MDKQSETKKLQSKKKLQTKEELYHEMLAKKFIDTELLSSNLLEWLDHDDDQEDNVIIDYDMGGQGGSIIWTRKLVLHGKSFYLDYVPHLVKILGRTRQVLMFVKSNNNNHNNHNHNNLTLKTK